MSQRPKFFERKTDNVFIFLSGNKTLSLDIIERYIDEKWNWESLSFINALTLDFVEKHIDKRWYWQGLDGHKDLNLEFVEKYIDKPWTWSRIFKKFNLGNDFLMKHPDKISEWSKEFFFNWKDLTLTLLNRLVRTDTFIINAPLWYIETKKLFKWDLLSRRNDLSIEFIEKHIDEDWNWFYISVKDFITPEFVLKHIDKKWDWPILSGNSKMTTEIYEKVFQKLYYPTLSYNPCVAEKFISDHIRENWDWLALSLNTNISFSFIDEHDDKNWDYSTIITRYVLEEDEKERAAEKIQIWWRKIYNNPRKGLLNVCKTVTQRKIDMIKAMTMYGKPKTNSFIDLCGEVTREGRKIITEGRYMDTDFVT